MRFPPFDDEEPPLDYADNLLEVDPLEVRCAWAGVCCVRTAAVSVTGLLVLNQHHRAQPGAHTRTRARARV
jgi:hypothetical protein